MWYRSLQAADSSEARTVNGPGMDVNHIHLYPQQIQRYSIQMNREFFFLYIRFIETIFKRQTII